MARTEKKTPYSASRKQCTGQRPGKRGYAQKLLNRKIRYSVGMDAPVVRKGVDWLVS